MQSLVKSKMIEIADEVYLLADHSKFGVQSFSRIAPLHMVDYVITDSNTNQKYLRALEDMDIKVTCTGGK